MVTWAQFGLAIKWARARPTLLQEYLRALVGDFEDARKQDVEDVNGVVVGGWGLD